MRTPHTTHAALQLASHHTAHTTLQLASPPTPLQGERGVVCFYNEYCLTHTHSIRPHLHSTRRGKGSNTPCFIAMHIVFARHTTPLSPWRGAGGEAGCRVVCAVWGEPGCRVACCVLCCSFSSFPSFPSFSFCLYLSLPNMRSR